MKRKYFGYLWDAWEASIEHREVFWKLRVGRIGRLLIVIGLRVSLEYFRSVDLDKPQWASCHLFGPFFWIVEEG